MSPAAKNSSVSCWWCLNCLQATPGDYFRCERCHRPPWAVLAQASLPLAWEARPGAALSLASAPVGLSLASLPRECVLEGLCALTLRGGESPHLRRGGESPHLRPGAFLFPCRLAPLAMAPPRFLGFTSSLGWFLATGHLRAGVEPEVAVAQGLLNKVGMSCVVDWSFRAQWHPCPQLPTLGSAWCPHWPDFPWTSPSCVGAVPLGCPSPSSLQAFLFHLLPQGAGRLRGSMSDSGPLGALGGGHPKARGPPCAAEERPSGQAPLQVQTPDLPSLERLSWTRALAHLPHRTGSERDSRSRALERVLVVN